MKTTILGLLSETSIHPGSGQDAGFVDKPVAREAATDYPVIVGSSFKGALLDRARARSDGMEEDERNQIFGKQDGAGSILVSDIRLIMLPIRSLTGTYKWVTCTHLLERFFRDLKRAEQQYEQVEIPTKLSQFQYIGKGDEVLYLEEREFRSAEISLPENLISQLQRFIAHEETKKRLEEQLVIICDDDFAWFARYGLSVNARNNLDDVKKTSKNLWYEETIPPDALFYALLAERNEGTIDKLLALFENKPYLQVGGNETIGQGWFALSLLNNNERNAK